MSKKSQGGNPATDIKRVSDYSIKLSASDQANVNKNYFYDFKSKEVKSLKHLGKLMLTHSLCTQLFTADPMPNKENEFPKPYRKTTDAVIDTGNVLFFDIDNASVNDSKIRCDNPITLKDIKKAFKRLGWIAVITPSKSSNNEWEKFHVTTITDRPVANYKTDKEVYRNQYSLVAHELNLDVDGAMKSAIQNLTPAKGREILAIVNGNPINLNTLNNDMSRGFAKRNRNGTESKWVNEIIDKKYFENIGEVNGRCDCPLGEKHSDGKGEGYGFYNDKGGISCNGCLTNYHWLSEDDINAGHHVFTKKESNTLPLSKRDISQMVVADDILPNIEDMLEDESLDITDFIQVMAKLPKTTYEPYLHKVKQRFIVTIDTIREEIAKIIKAKRNEERPDASYPDFFESDEGYMYLSTMDNMKQLLDNLDLTYHYDIIKKGVKVEGWDNENNWNEKLWSHSLSEAVKTMLPKSIMQDHYTTALLLYEKNPLLDLIENINWDGNDHITELAQRIKSKTGNFEYRREILMRWLIQCVSAWDSSKRTTNQEAIPKYEYIFVLGGGQGVGKTTLFKKLMPESMSDYFLEGALLNPSDKDSVKQCTSFGMVELGELDATTRKSDVAELKAFLSNQWDIYRVPYARSEEKHRRRTSFCGSVNPTTFLNDPTGARRFLYILLEGDINVDGIDFMQLWAQVWSLYLNGDRWWLNRGDEAYTMQTTINEQATDTGIVGDVIMDLKQRLKKSKGNEQKRISATKLWTMFTDGKLPTKVERSIFYTELEKIKGLKVSKHNGIAIPKDWYMKS